MAENRVRLNGIQVIRAFCCMCVLFAHGVAYAEMRYGLVIGQTLSYWGRYGMLNTVYIFFAVSGFFVTSSIVNSDDGFFTVLKKRLLRIYPTYWCAIIFCVLLYLSVVHTLTVNSEFALTFLLMPRWTPYILKVEWTLLYDMMFYFISAIFQKKRLRKYWPAFLVCWAIAIGIQCFNLGINSSVSVNLPGMLLDERNFSLIAGSVSYYVYEKFNEKVNLKKSVNWLLALGSVAVFFINCQYFYGLSAIGAVINYLILIPIVFFFAKVNVRSTNPAVQIGNYSYGIYLVHASILDVAFAAMAGRGMGLGKKVYCIAVGLALIGGLAFGLFDTKLVKWTKQKYLKH